MRARDMAGADGFVSQIYAERTDDDGSREAAGGIQSTRGLRLPQAVRRVPYGGRPRVPSRITKSWLTATVKDTIHGRPVCSSGTD